jgi:protein subunit release factor A
MSFDEPGHKPGCWYVWCCEWVEKRDAAKIDDKDLQVDTWTYGDRVIVRLTHVPSGIYAECRDYFSRHHNKEAAMKMLIEKLEKKGRMEPYKRHDDEQNTGDEVI